MGINVLPAPATGDPAAQQVVFPSTSAVSLTTALPVGVYELTTDTVQLGTFQFTVGGAAYASFMRGGKAFVDLSTAGAGATSITPPSGGTFPMILNIRAASLNSAGAVYAAVPIDYLVIAGGGGASASNSEYASNAGGGAGGYLTASTNVYRGNTITVTVGAGGTAGTLANSNAFTHGSSSAIVASALGLSVTTVGGGKGGVGYSGPSRTTTEGGSGGGGSGGGNGGNGTAGQGNRGGDNLSSYGGSGGGGAGIQGTDYPSGSPNNGQATTGGYGLSSSITGSAVTRAGGGGGGWSSYYGTPVQAENAGGTGGGGQGGSGADNTGNNWRSYAATGGTANTGGGGGGAGSTGGASNYLKLSGGAGGSGVVIIRFPDTLAAAASTTGSPTVTNPTGYRVYTFTGSGSITF
jgi:hypothetical protein